MILGRPAGEPLAHEGVEPPAVVTSRADAGERHAPLECRAHERDRGRPAAGDLDDARDVGRREFESVCVTQQSSALRLLEPQLGHADLDRPPARPEPIECRQCQRSPCRHDRREVLGRSAQEPVEARDGVLMCEQVGIVEHEHPVPVRGGERIDQGHDRTRACAPDAG